MASAFLINTVRGIFGTILAGAELDDQSAIAGQVTAAGGQLVLAVGNPDVVAAAARVLRLRRRGGSDAEANLIMNAAFDTSHGPLPHTHVEADITDLVHTPPDGGSDLFRFEPNQSTYPATLPAAAASRNEHPLAVFDDTLVESIVLHGSMSADYSNGAFTAFLEWVATSAIIGDAKLDVEFEALAGQDIDGDGFAAVQSSTDTTNGTSGIQTITSIAFTQAQADGLVAGGGFRLRVTCDAVDAGHTIVGDVQLQRVRGEQ